MDKGDVNEILSCIAKCKTWKQSIIVTNENGDHINLSNAIVKGASTPENAFGQPGGYP